VLHVILRRRFRVMFGVKLVTVGRVRVMRALLVIAQAP
jgi:hypothetical protein